MSSLLLRRHLCLFFRDNHQLIFNMPAFSAPFEVVTRNSDESVESTHFVERSIKRSPDNLGDRG